MSEPSELTLRATTLWRRMRAQNTLWTFLVLVALVVVFSALRPAAFATVFEARSIATESSILVLLAVGQTFVIVTAGIDLSVGSVLIFSGVVAVKVMNGLDGSPRAGWDVVALGTLAGLGAGLAWGALNGLLIAKAKVPPLIVTLGTLGMALGLAQVATHGVDAGNLPDRLTDSVGSGTLLGIPWLIVIAAVVAAIAAYVLHATRFGRYTLAIGSNAESVSRVGIRGDLHLVKVYALSGLLAGFAGVLNLAHFSSTTLTSGTQDNLNAIAAVVLGGTSLFGGTGTVVGTVIGVFIPAVLQSGFTILQVQSFWQTVAVGAVLIAAVYLDQLRRRRRASS
ncbi:ABC transporter permease [Kitasatospora viridis]|uniref:Monosaccharide ABC transporter membrane protein (CUT2 family) n=1 Tax=Kitasatospora viridis TaxID=281105 RepID=A0A561T6Q8_9ACTN|nr:ABC transporter permease [Kitasatospora viridis]TWF82780.1 monosaccharide ABC transporter membrane protein (CUT2 family) [Kitasatospora viridis]